MSKKGKLQMPYFTFSKSTLTNKYFIVTAVFFCWMMFFDKNSFPTNFRLSRNVTQLKEVKSNYERKIAEARSEKKEIEENKEKYAREHYLMHKDNEDVIVIEKTKK